MIDRFDGGVAMVWLTEPHPFMGCQQSPKDGRAGERGSHSIIQYIGGG